MRNINTFTNDIIKINGVITITVKLNDWTTEDIKVTVVENWHRLIIGCNFLPPLELSLNQSKLVLFVK